MHLLKTFALVAPGLLFTGQLLAERPSTLRNSHYDAARSQLAQIEADYANVLAATPRIYEFTSQFNDLGSVSYTGQTFRQVLIAEWKTFADSLERGAYMGTADQALAALDSFYDYDAYRFEDVFGAINGFEQMSLVPRDLKGVVKPIAEGVYFDDVQADGKQLLNKTAGNDNPLRRGSLQGWSLTRFGGIDLAAVDRGQEADGRVEPEDLVTAWMQLLARNAAAGETFTVPNAELAEQSINAAGVTPEGWNLAQLTQKFLHGAVSFSQAARDYLSVELGASKGLNGSNEDAYKPGANYTQLEHHWDEAFGYFGAARDYLLYDLEAIASGRSRDTNEDGQISLQAEWNAGIAPNAAKRQLGAATDVAFTSEIMKSFLMGRQLITAQPEGYRQAARAKAVYLLGQWEQVIAATVVHYINDTLADYDRYGQQSYSFTHFAKVWSEMKGYALAFQFSPVAIMSDSSFDYIHRLMGDQPVLPHADASAVASYRQKLVEVRDTMRLIYGFSEDNVKNW